MQANRRYTFTLSGIFVRIALFFFLLYPYFNSTIRLVYFKDSIANLTILLSAAIVAFLVISKRNTRFTLLDGVWCIVLLLCAFRNQDVAHGNLYSCMRSCVCFFILVLLGYIPNWEKYALRLVCLFSSIQLFFGYLFFFDQSLFVNYVQPTMGLEGYWETTINNNLRSGYMVGLTSHYSTFGMYMSFALILAFTFVLNQNKRKKIDIRQYLFLGITFIAFLLNAKRGPFLFSVCSILAVYFVCYVNVSVKTIGKWIAVVCCGVIAINIAKDRIPEIENFFARFDFTSNHSLNDFSTGRIELLWLPALALFASAPIFGIGWGGYKYSFLALSTMDRNNDAHNIYLQLLCEVGLVGFCIVMLALIWSLYNTLKCFRKVQGSTSPVKREDCMILCFSLMIQVYFLSYGLTGNPLYDRPMYLYAIAYALYRSTDRRYQHIMD